jgi:hypothetical protein
MTTVVCFTMNQLGEPDAGKPHVRFDERGVETELRLLRHASTLLKGECQHRYSLRHILTPPTIASLNKKYRTYEPI